jgi:hypothetical protein
MRSLSTILPTASRTSNSPPSKWDEVRTRIAPFVGFGWSESGTGPTGRVTLVVVVTVVMAVLVITGALRSKKMAAAFNTESPTINEDEGLMR